MADLLGGTSGQILSKASNTDMDFTWITNDVGDITAVTAGTGISGGGTSGAVTITNSMATAIDAKGDLVVGTGADTFSRLAVGADYGFLSALASESTGQKWTSDWTAWTSTVTNGSIGNGIQTSRYIRIGKLCVARFQFALGTTSTITGDFRFTIPFSAATQSNVCGFGNMFIGGGVSPAITEIAGSDCYVRVANANSTYVGATALSATVPATWGSGNWIGVQLIYEVA
jgi:hypothetical protein